MLAKPRKTDHMTIQREYMGGPHVVQCDECLDTEELHGDTRQEAINDAKERGFHAHFDGRKWTCAHCSKAAEQAAELAFRIAEDRYEKRLAA